MKYIKEKVGALLAEVNTSKPRLPERLEDWKVHTIDFFDLFYREYQNVLIVLWEFYYFIVADNIDLKELGYLLLLCVKNNLKFIYSI